MAFVKKLAVAFVLLLVSVAPAHAAVPKTAPSDSLRCSNGKTAKAWLQFNPSGWLSMLAAENPCTDRWVALRWPGHSVSDPYGSTYFLAPGKKFNFDTARLYEWGIREHQDEYAGLTLVEPKQACVTNRYGINGWTNFTGKLISSWDNVRDAPECGDPPPKHLSTRHAPIYCPKPDTGPSDLAWKLDGKKVIKIEIHNACNFPVVAWWHFKDPRTGSVKTAAVWVGAGFGYTDLWKSELNGLPVKTIDGKVHFSDDRVYDEANFSYNWSASGDQLNCVFGPCNWRG